MHSTITLYSLQTTAQVPHNASRFTKSYMVATSNHIHIAQQRTNSEQTLKRVSCFFSKKHKNNNITVKLFSTIVPAAKLHATSTQYFCLFLSIHLFHCERRCYRKDNFLHLFSSSNERVENAYAPQKNLRLAFRHIPFTLNVGSHCYLFCGFELKPFLPLLLSQYIIFPCNLIYIIFHRAIVVVSFFVEPPKKATVGRCLLLVQTAYCNISLDSQQKIQSRSVPVCATISVVAKGEPTSTMMLVMPQNNLKLNWSKVPHLKMNKLKGKVEREKKTEMIVSSKMDGYTYCVKQMKSACFSIQWKSKCVFSL